MRALCLAIVIAGLSGPALGQEPERIEAVLPSVYEASIEIDAGLEMLPAIQSSIRNDELAALASFSALAVEDHARWMEEAPEWSWNGYFQDVTVEIAYTGQDAVSLIRRASYYTGGAHPNQSVDAVLTRTASYDPLGLADLLTDTAAEGPAMTALFYALYRELMAIKQARLGEGFDERVERETWLSSLAAEVDAFPAFSLLPNESGSGAAGLVFHFEPYEVGSYVEGAYDVPVPLNVFEAYLSEDWQSVFAGQPAQTILSEPDDERASQVLMETEN